MDSHRIKEIGQAVEAGNAKKVASLLECKTKKTFSWQEASLLGSSPQANQLLKFIASTLSNEPVGSKEALTFNRNLRALLAVSPCFETPWIAVFDVASKLSLLSGIMFYDTISALEEFFGQIMRLSDRDDEQNPDGIDQEQVPVNREPDNPKSAVGVWMFRILQVLIDALLLGNPKRNTKAQAMAADRCPVVSELVGTLFSTAQKWGRSLFHLLTMHLIDYTPHATRCATWLRILKSMFPLLPEDHVEMVQKSLRAQIDKSKLKIPLGDIKGILDVTLRWATTSTVLVTNTPQAREKWLQIVWQTLHVASSNHEVYSEMEGFLLSMLADSPARSVDIFLQGAEAAMFQSNAPKWMSLNIMLGATQSFQHSTARKVSKWLARAMKAPQSSNNCLEQCCGLIQKLIFGPNQDLLGEILPTEDNQKLDGSNVILATDSVLYEGKGSFHIDEKDVTVLSDAGRILLHCICLGRSADEGREGENGVALRALRALNMAQTMVNSATGEASTAALLWAVIVWAIVYTEFPRLRSDVVTALRKEFSSHEQAESQPPASVYCAAAAVNLVVRSSNHDSTRQMSNLHPLCGLMDNPVRGDIFCHLILSMSSLPKARENIVLSSRRVLQQHFAVGWEEVVESFDDRRESLFQSCLLGLLEVIRVPAWGDCEIEAWKLLSECIVSNEPHVSLFHRRWLYRRIQEIINAGDLSQEAGEHIFRASVVRLYSFFSEKDSGSAVQFILERVLLPGGGSDENTRLLEDISLLLHLILSILNYLASSDHDYDSRTAIVAKGREALLRSILAYKDIADIEKHRAVANFVKRCTGSTKSGEGEVFAFYCSVSIYLVSCILECLMRHQCTAATRRCQPSESTPSLKQSINRILLLETASLRSMSSCQRGESNFPSWLQNRPMSANAASDEESSTLLSGIIFELFDFMIELLCKPNLPTCGLQDSNRALSRSVTLAVGKLLRCKGSLLQSSVAESTMLNSDVCAGTAPDFLSMSLSATRNAFRGDFELVEAADILSPVLEYCDTLYALPEESDAAFTPALLECIWALYQSTAGEDSAKSFIDYLEGRRSERNQSSDAGQSIPVISPLSIKSGEDIDNCVQTVRLQVVRTLQRCLSSIDFDQTSQDEELAGSRRETDETSLTVQHCDLLVDMFQSLSRDLRSGLEGRSGGVTPDLYLVYMCAMDECAELLFESCLTSQSSVSPTIFLDVSEAVTGILSTFPLEDAELFRFSFVFATATLPSWYRRILRQRPEPADRSNLAFERLHRFDSSFMSNAFSECLAILTRWSVLRDPDSLPWVDLAGEKHADTGDDEIIAIGSAMDRDAKQPMTTEVSRVSHESSSRGPAVFAREKCSPRYGNSSFVRLSAKEVWSWTLSCTLIVIECQWIESYTVMMPTEGRESTRLTYSLLPDRLAFFENRKAELLLCCKRAGRFFGSSLDSGRTQQQPAIDMLAMNLPSAPRHRLCGVLNRLALVLGQSVDTIIQALENEREVLDRGHGSSEFLEAMCCLSAWMHHEGTHAGVTEGTIRWLSLLKRKRPPGEVALKRGDTLMLISSLSKTEKTQHSIKSGMKKLRDLLNARKDSFGASLLALFSVFYQGGVDEMVRLVSSKISLLEEAMPTSNGADSFPQFPATEDQNTKKRPRRAAKWKPLKRIPVRSRNKVVNIFMHLDQGIHDSGGSSADAFVDLEDFLVEG